MHDAGSVALALDGIWRLNMVLFIVLHPIPFDWPALEEIKSRCPKEPKYNIHKVNPPGDAQPSLLD